MAKGFFSIGEYGNRVRLYERGKALYIVFPKDGTRGHKSLGNITHAEARRKAYALHEQLLERAEVTLTIGELTLRQLLAAYRRQMTQHKKDKGTRNSEMRVIDLALAVFGPNASPSEIGETEALRLHRLRSSGEVDAFGKPVPEGKRRRVSDSTASADVKTLRRIVKWGARNKHVRENNLDGILLPMNRDPDQPVASPARYTALREVAPQIRSRFGTWQKWEEDESYFAVILDLAWHTGRRINSLLQLRKVDYRPHMGDTGALYFRGEAEKGRISGLVPINAEAQRAIEKQLTRDLLGTWMFPSPMKQDAPLNPGIARQWLQRAEELAELEHVPGGGWHMFRRGFVNLRKGMSETDLAALGGWKNANVMRQVYQKPDFATMSQVVQNPIPDEEQ